MIAPEGFHLPEIARREARKRGISLDFLPLGTFSPERITAMRRRMTVTASDADGLSYPPETIACIGEQPDLCFDDQPLEVILYDAPETPPTPADIVKLWLMKGQVSEHQKLILQNIRSRNPVLFNLLERNPRTGNEEITLFLRTESKACLDRGEFEQAERIYRHLENMNFELPGTLCHLARVQILLYQYDKARASADQAWTLRKKALNYVLPRIIWFKILFCLLDKQNPSVWLRRMKKALHSKDVCMDWDLILMLEMVRPDLTPEAFRFLQHLGDALQNPQNWEYQKVRISEYQNAFKTP